MLFSELLHRSCQIAQTRFRCLERASEDPWHDLHKPATLQARIDYGHTGLV